jgi:hypothetical protein
MPPVSKSLTTDKERPETMSDKPRQPYNAEARKAQLQERAVAGAKAMTEYKAEGASERAKTSRLRALRLAKEAANKSKN